MQPVTPEQTLASRFRLPRFNSWDSAIVLTALLVATPVLVITAFVFFPANENWKHLLDTLLADYVINSILLMIGVSFGVLSIGILCAWLTSMCEFPGRKILSWLLLLPLAFPAYIIAYTYTGLLDFEGPLQSLIRAQFNWRYGEYWFPEVRSLAGAATMLSLVLYPYVYLMARAAFLEQSICVLEVSRTLGNGAINTFRKVALPLARPAIVTGLSLALMETLADYGTVQYFGVSTFTTGIFRTWFGMGDSTTAAQLSAVLMGFVFVLILLERWSRKRARFHHTSGKYSAIDRYQLSGSKAWLALIACLLPVLFGFALPAAQLLTWTLTTAEETVDASFLTLTAHSLLLASISAVVAVAFALMLAYGKRLRNTILTTTSVRLAAMGYAIPGTVIAMGVILPLAWFDNTLDNFMRVHFNFSTGLLFSGTLFALIFAYIVRFLSVSIQAVESGLAKIKPSIDDAGRSLGLSPIAVLKQLHLPLMKGTVLTALLLVFVDVLKELPATLILRPFNYNTLAVRAYEMAADERLADAGAPALMIVLTGIIPVILLSKVITHSRAGNN